MLHDLIGAIPEAERSAHVALVTRLFGDTAQEKQEVPTGYVFRFPPEAFDQVAQFVSRERRCCPFLAFEITLTPHDGPLWLQMTGPDGAREFLATELPSITLSH